MRRWPSDSRLYVGPSLRRLRRDRGLTQADMAADLEVSPSYIALLERNHRPLSAEMLLRLAQTYAIDLSTLAGNGPADERARLQAALKDPIFADIDLPSLETSDVVTNFPGVVEAFLRLYTTYQEEHLALADRGVDGVEAADPVAEARRFLAARRNSFPLARRGCRTAGAEHRRARQPGRLSEGAARPAGQARAAQGHGRVDAAPRLSSPPDPARRRTRPCQPDLPAGAATGLSRTASRRSRRC